MTIQLLIKNLEKNEISISLDESKTNLKVFGNIKNLTSGDKNYIVQNKQEIIIYLINRAKSDLNENGPSKKTIQFWKEILERELPIIDFPSFRTREKTKENDYSNSNHVFLPNLYNQMQSFSSANDLSLLVLVVSAIKILLHRYTNQEDVIVGIVNTSNSNNKNRLEVMPILSSITDKSTFLEYIHNEDLKIKDANKHLDIQFHELINLQNQNKEISNSNLIDILIELKSSNHPNKNRTVENKSEIEKPKALNVDIHFIFEEAEHLSLKIVYNSYKFDQILIDRIFEHFENLLLQALDNPKQAINQIDYLSQDEKNQLVEEFNKSNVKYSKNKTLVDLFEEQVAKTPNNIAVVFENTRLTYTELNKLANKLAHYIRDNFDIKANDLIGIKLERDERLVIVVLGILKSGAAYVPIDPYYPTERIKLIEDDSNCKVVLDESQYELFLENQNNYQETNPKKINSSEDLAYVIYTSGTTGVPKGVLVQHSGVVSISECWKKQYDLDKIPIVLLQLASISFDVFAGDLCRSLLNGGKMVVCPNEFRLQPDNLYKIIQENKVTILEGTPALLLTLCDYVFENGLNFDFLKILIFGSDSFNNQDYCFIRKSIGDEIKIINSYGVTEATIDSTFYDDLNEDFVGTTPIGKPFANSNLFILDNFKKLVPIGVFGKLFIGGDGVTKGYLNNPELTNEKFISISINQGGKVYDTGDIGRWLPNGNIEFLGRNDNQVKIRGYRIELGEIEATLLKFSKYLKNALVEVKEINDEKALVAYYVCENELNKIEIKNFLLDKLPDYLVPSFYVSLNQLPITPNGKIDRKKLPEVSVDDLIKRDFVAPQNETQEILRQIWSRVLKLEDNQISINSNFFEIGGTSLTVIKLVNEINNSLKSRNEISPVTIFEFADIKSLSDYIDQDVIEENYIDESLDDTLNILNQTLNILDENQ